jgi:biopolymer transport protein ExbD
VTQSSPGRNRLEFELNIVPVIDCLTILVTFMLAAGVYYSIAMLDIRLSGAGKEKAAAATGAKVAISVDLDAQQTVSVRVTGEETRSLTFPRRDGKVDVESLGRELASLKIAHADVKSATLNSNREAPYQDMVSVLETLRRSHPDVLLGGF